MAIKLIFIVCAMVWLPVALCMWDHMIYSLEAVDLMASTKDELRDAMGVPEDSFPEVLLRLSSMLSLSCAWLYCYAYGHDIKREGFSKYNKIYEFDYQMLNKQCNMVMTSVSGHLLSLDFIGQYKKWHSCSPVSLFDVPVEKFCPDNFVDIKRTLEREIRRVQYLVIWTDCDREGENIGFEVIQVCKAVKPNIPVYRAKFSEITPRAIERACQNLIAPHKDTSDAVDVRSELDLRIGAAFTRFQTMRLQKVFPGVLADQLISYGSCQFPTLGFVVERYKQVQAFIPEPFWRLKVEHKIDDAAVDFTWKRNRLFDYTACYVLYQQCIENPLAKVTDTQNKSKSKWRPTALDTVELEKYASRKLRINAKETMKIAEKLYTQGYISYPRTETNIFPKDLDLGAMVEHQTRDPSWGDFARRLLERGPTPRNGKKTDNAHPPIHPTKYTDNLQGDEKRVYEFIVRHFLACCSQDAQGYETTVQIEIAGEMFTAHGLMVIAKNYLEVFTYEKWFDKTMPVLEKGGEFEPCLIEMVSGETRPPPLLSEADLITLMDKHGIGTDATHADHIETIKSRKYVGLQGDGRFVPGQLGMGLVEGYDAMGYEMSKPHLRAELEADLKKICEGKKDKQVVLDDQVGKYKEVFIEACKQATKIDESVALCLGTDAQAAPPVEGAGSMLAMGTPVMKCPLCGQDMVLRPKKDNKGFYIGCMGFPDCRSAIWLPDSVLDASVQEETCPRCGPSCHVMRFKFKRGSVPPTVPTEYTGCVAGCDDILLTDVGIRPPKPPSTNSTQGQGHSRSQPSSRDSGYNSGSSSSRNSSGSRNMSTLASRQPSVANMFNPNRALVTPTMIQTPNNQTNDRNSGYNRTNKVIVTSSNSSMKSSTTRPNDETQNRASTNSFTTNQSFNLNCDRNKPATSPVTSVNSRVPLANMSGNAGDVVNKTVCNCGNDAIQLTVKKEGPNTGRQFYKCGSSGCGFFLWSDEAGGTTTPDHSRQSQPPRLPTSRGTSLPGPTGDHSTSAGGVSCQCDQPARSLTVLKEGPNKGRPFYGCPAPRDQGCGFFQWADEDPAGDSHVSGGRVAGHVKGSGSKKRAAPSTTGTATKKGRSCGLCGVEGHTKRTCPQR